MFFFFNHFYSGISALVPTIPRLLTSSINASWTACNQEHIKYWNGLAAGLIPSSRECRHSLVCILFRWQLHVSTKLCLLQTSDESVWTADAALKYWHFQTSAAARGAWVSILRAPACSRNFFCVSTAKYILFLFLFFFNKIIIFSFDEGICR